MIKKEAKVKCHIRKKELFDLLTKNIKFDETKSICLFSLGSPYYAKRIEKEYPDIKITIVEDREMEFLFCDTSNVNYVNINDKELWPKTMENVNFDCIIMNPPYSGNLHLKILQEAIKHADKTVNLSPCEWLLRPYYKPAWEKAYKDLEDLPTNGDPENFGSALSHLVDLEVFPSTEACSLFNIQFEDSLGLYTFMKNNNHQFVYKNLYDVEGEKQINRFSKGAYLIDHIEEYYNQKYFCPLRKDAHQGRWWKFQLVNYLDVLVDGKIYSGSYKGKTILEAREANPHENGRNNGRPTFGISFNSLEELLHFRNSVKTKSYLYIISLIKTGRSFPMKKLPWLGDVINPLTGKKGYESEWTDEAFYKYFEITEEEQKIIEETMEKYK